MSPNRPHRSAVLCLAILGAACSGTAPAPPATSEGVPAPACPERWTAREGGGCAPIVASGPCEPGSMPMLGQPGCVPVGWTECPEGFAKSPSGWGCRAVLPPSPCTGATRDALGGACVPIGDCSAPFPPANATVFVDPRFTAAQLDDTHYRSLHAALLAAVGGEVIAVEAGEYVEWNDLDVPVTIVGRCPEKVVLRAPAPENVALLCTTRASVSGVKLVGFDAGFAAKAGCDATVSQVVIEDSGTFGVYAQDKTRLTLRDAAIRGTQGRRDTNGYVAAGVFASDAAITVKSAAVTSSVDFGLAARFATSELSVSDLVVRDLRLNPRRLAAVGLSLDQGAHARVSRSAILDVDEAGAIVRGAGSRLELTDSTVSNVRQVQQDHIAVDVGIFDAGMALLDRVQLERAEGIGLLTHGAGTSAALRHATVVDQQRSPLYHWDFGVGVNLLDHSAVTVDGSALVNNLRAAVEVREAGTSLTFNGSLAQGTRPSGEALATGGWGALVLDGAATLTDSAFLNNGPAAVAAAVAKLDVRRSILRGTRPSPLNPGTSYGLLSSEDTRTRLEELVVDDNGTAGLVFGLTGAQVLRSWVSRHAVGVHLFEATLEQSDADPGTERVVAVDAATQFVDNRTTVGFGEIALPNLTAGPPP